MKLYAVYCIITADPNKGQNYVLSTDSKEIVLPYAEIVNPKVLHNELRYNVKKMFNDNTIRFIEEIIISYTEIQTQPIVNYIEQINTNNTFDLDNSLFLLCGIIIQKKNSKDFKWKKYEMSQELVNNPLFAIIDRTIQKSLL
jgi:hypothetical protein